MLIQKLTQTLLRRAARLPALAATFGAGVLAVATLAAPASAQTAAVRSAPAADKTVSVALTQFKVVKGADGKEQLLDASSVKPGDVLEYRATYTNNTGKTVSGLVADLPIPEGLEYLPRSAKPGAALVKAATKDGVYAAEPLVRKAANNKTEPVPYSDYRALRWTLGQLPAGGEAAVTARAEVEVVVPPEPKTSALAPQAPPVAVQSASGAASR